MASTISPATSQKVQRGLKQKLVLSMLMVGAIPLLVGLTMAFLQGTKKIQEVSGESFEALATESARKIDLIISDEIARTAEITTDVTIIQALESRRDQIASYNKSSLQTLLSQESSKWNAKEPAFVDTITQNPIVTILQRYYGGIYVDPGHPIPVVTRSATRGLFITDMSGRLVASLKSQIPYIHVDAPSWQGAFKNGVGQPYLSAIEKNEHYDTHIVTLSLPIMDSIRYQAIGVLHRIYDIKELLAPSIDTIRFGDTGHVMLVDSNGIVLSCPILSTGTQIKDPDLIPLFTPRQPGWTLAPNDGHDGNRSSIIGFTALPTTSQTTHASTGQAWHMFVWQSSEELFAPIEHLFTWISAFGLLAIGLLMALGFLMAGRIVTPIRQLQEAAKLIGRGQWQEPVQIKTGDELEALADEVNRMNQQLAFTFAGLESEVETQKQEVQYLQESTTQILDSVPEPVIMLDQEEKIQYMNRATREAFHLNGHPQLKGLPLFQAFPIDPTTQHQLEKEFQSIRSMADDIPDQSTSPLPSHPQTIRDPLQHSMDRQVVSERQEIHIHQRRYRYELFTVKAKLGEPSAVGLVLRNVTEEGYLQDRLIREEKLASLGVLSAGIGHELNNPLVGVIGLGEAIQDEQNLTKIQEYAHHIVEHGRRMASIVKDFTGKATSQLNEEVVDIHFNEQLDQILNTLSEICKTSSISIHTHYETLPILKGNSHELAQALSNIILNAIQAVGEAGNVEIETSAQDQEIHIYVRDNGPGIPPTHLSKIFDPFFTTKKQGEGAGLGLAIARRIIQKHGGQLEISSGLGQGTTCHITFLLHEHPSEHIQEDQS